MEKIFIEVHQPRAGEKTALDISTIEGIYEIKKGGRYTPVLTEEAGAKTLIYMRGRVVPVTESYRQVKNLITRGLNQYVR